MVIERILTSRGPLRFISLLSTRMFEIRSPRSASHGKRRPGRSVLDSRISRNSSQLAKPTSEDNHPVAYGREDDAIDDVLVGNGTLSPSWP